MIEYHLYFETALTDSQAVRLIAASRDARALAGRVGREETWRGKSGCSLCHGPPRGIALTDVDKANDQC